MKNDQYEQDSPDIDHVKYSAISGEEGGNAEGEVGFEILFKCTYLLIKKSSSMIYPSYGFQNVSLLHYFDIHHPC